MKTLLVSISILFFTFLGSLHAQDSCKVLITNLQGSYSGECKKGLAHGNGIAKGVDTYEGSFKKGYPSGFGKYSWSNGAVYEGEWREGLRKGEGKYTSNQNGKLVVLDGIWKNDNYIGPKPIPPKIIMKQYITQANFVRSGDGNTITIKTTQNGMAMSVEDLYLQGSSGSQFVSGITSGYQAVDFPFTCKVTYRCWNAMRSILRERSIQFEIVQPGNWEVKLDND